MCLLIANGTFGTVIKNNGNLEDLHAKRYII